ncbi:hypothetical protein [Psychrobacter sp. FME5]|uniref:hypothetical protein n=1 Tax=Psychrobacter sp. FME5 TaxID=2487706 RepID=UPI00178835A6|nr:hypothetical protein [Psychrobacter sp. FME5]MBE0446048.1 hypothetical protein [Psychrobacter sp. FME5]
MLPTIIKVATYKRSISTAVSAVLLLSAAGCVSTPSTTQSSTDMDTIKTATHCEAQLPTHSTNKDQNIQQRTMNCMLTQLKEYQQADKTAHQQYLAYKAQAWLNYTSHQDSINSRSPADTYALQTAETILQALKDDTAKDIDLYQDIPSMSALMRPDLWATISALKDSDGIDSAPREIAFSEVALIWAATNQCARSERDSGTHFRKADRWLEQAREAYVNSHNSETNVALQALIVRYYKLYSPLSSVEDTCSGQVLPTIDSK